ncbi:PP2C family protein-serine/threonine phosphatase [Actinacidiphila acidipaludis]|uniref:Serine/threonine-protein phosphatase n=1 Tax=Actinacidiphila acidipaludis TaxID=2873382 RepID=A0ABS7Q5H9_9ACTN|nr:PP2C family protein-serine/threonine phosphatase [Streptomyces acidipaludis]MBY8878223.1 serine/threonine-protein phosphatase [Streptomyces acidipaludis]
MTSIEGNPVAGAGQAPTSGLWALAPYPVIVADASGTVVRANPAAALLLREALPGASMADTVPGWLARAHREALTRFAAHAGCTGDLPAPSSGPVGARSFEAHPTPSPGGEIAWWLIDGTDRRVAEQALATERQRTGFLVEASNVLLASLNTERCMAATVRLAAEYLADVAIVVAPPTRGRLPVVHAVAGQSAVAGLIAADPSSLPGLAEALRGFPPLPSRWIDGALLPDWLLPEGFTGTIGSVVVTSLPGHGVPAGALILLRRGDQARFSEDEEIFARLFAARAGAALSAARLYGEQTAITQTLMRELLPPRMQRLNGVDFAGGYRPAEMSERVGGDFYDIHAGPSPDDASLVVLGDVCGKGLDAAVLTGKIRSTLQALTPMVDDHERILNLLNGSLLNSHHARFATMVLASVQRAENEVRLRLTSAGHPTPLIVRLDGTVEEVPTRGTLIGALPRIESHSAQVVLQPGETCLLYTDGFTEARGGPLGNELFGEERLKRVLSHCADMPAEAVVERIQMLASEWLHDGGHDDMALVAISAPRTTHLSAVDGHTRGRYTV